MAYIGRNPAIGTQKVLDSLESQFNGTLTTFDLRYLGNTIYPPIASALIVSLGGVLQEPGVAYTVASDTITFASAPPTGSDCWILLYTEFGGAAGATANLTVSNNLTIGNELHGPANFVIDPATIGDNTGTVEIKGNLTVQGTQTTVNSTTVDLDHLSLGDNEIANFGDGNDLQIYHDGSDSYINDTGTGALQVRTSALILRSNVGENIAFAYSNGAVQLFHNNSQKFATTSTGITVTGTVVADGLSLEDDEIANFGTDNDIQIVHESTGNKSVIKRTTTGDLYIQGASGSWIHIEALPGESSIKAAANGTVELYYDNSKKLETTNTGVTVTENVGINTSTINNRLHIHSDANEQGILLTQAGDNYSSIISDTNRSAEDKYILNLEAQWNGSKVARISFETGDDTTNKDDGRIKFFTSAASGNIGVAMRIEPDKKVGIGGDHDPLSPLHVKVNTASLLRLERDGNTNAGIRFENDTSGMHAGLSSSATFFGIGTSENIGSSATQFCVTRADGNVGIGNTAPVNRLQVSGGDATFDNNTYIGFNIYNNSGWYQLGTGNGAVLKHHSTNGFQIYTGPDSGNGAGGAASVSARLTISDSGNVGIGTNTPSTKLQIVGSTNSTDSSGGILGIRQSGDGNGDGITLTSSHANSARFYKDSDGKLHIFNTGGSSNQFVLDNADNVGIGLDSPLGNLHVSSGNSGDCKLILEADTDNDTEGDNSFIIFKLDGGVETASVWCGNADGSNDNSLNLSSSAGANGGIRFFTTNTAGDWETATERMRITTGGNVGVGTNDPDEKLHVNGNIYFSNFALISNYDAAVGGISGSNIDHIWHDDTAEFGTGGSWNFASDGSYKSLASLSNIKVGHVYVDNGNLGTSAGDIQDLARFFSNNGNATSIRLQAKRKIAGTNWNSAGYKIFCHTDATEQGYLEFNPHTTTAGDGNYDVAIGSKDGEIIRFTTEGNVGIGTTSPAYKLEVEGDIKVGELGTLWFSDASGSIEKIASGSNSGTLDLYADADIHFFESDSSVRKFTVDVNNAQLDLGDNLDTNTPQVHFDYHENCWLVGPNVGIGTTNPTQKLEVKGGSIFIRDDGFLITNRVRCGDGGQELILTAGESHAYIGQSPSSQYPPTMGGEKVYLVAESGMEIYSSSGNWVNSGAVRRTGTFCDSNGNGSLPGTLTQGSDARLKTNIRTIPDALEKVKSLRGAIFNRVDKDNKEEIGLIAQEVEEVLPQVVEESEYTWNDEKMKAIGYGKMVGLLIEAVKEQQVMIDKLRQEITELKNS